MAATDCIFCKIASGAIPSFRVFENADCFAFLDIGPLAPGHTLLVPKHHCTNLLDAPPELLSRLAMVLPRLARAVKNASGASGVNLLQNSGLSSGQVVMHLHFHLIPRVDSDKLGYRWNAGKYGPGQGEQIQARLIETLAAAQS